MSCGIVARELVKDVCAARRGGGVRMPNWCSGFRGEVDALVMEPGEALEDDLGSFDISGAGVDLSSSSSSSPSDCAASFSDVLFEIGIFASAHSFTSADSHS